MATLYSSCTILFHHNSFDFDLIVAENVELMHFRGYRSTVPRALNAG